MFSNLLRQQARLAFSARLTVPFRHQSQKSVLALSAQKSQILSQRTFSISRSLFEEAPVTPAAPTPATDATPHSQTADTGVAEDAGVPDRRFLYVGNIPYSAEEGEIRELLSSYGQIQHIKIGADAEGRQLGYAFVEFKSPVEAAAVVQSSTEEPFVLLNRDLRITFAKNLPRQGRRNDRAKEKSVGRPNKTLHIANYPKPGDDRLLRQMLGDYQEKILRVDFMKDVVGQDTEKAFVQFTDVETAMTVLETFQEKPLEGTNLKFYYAKERTRAQADSRRPSNNQAFNA